MTYTELINNLKEVKSGKRGFVSLNKKIAKEIGINQGQLFVVAKALNLKIDVHGKYGYCALLDK